MIVAEAALDAPAGEDPAGVLLGADALLEALLPGAALLLPLLHPAASNVTTAASGTTANAPRPAFQRERRPSQYHPLPPCRRIGRPAAPPGQVNHPASAGQPGRRRPSVTHRILHQGAGSHDG